MDVWQRVRRFSRDVGGKPLSGSRGPGKGKDIVLAETLGCSGIFDLRRHRGLWR